MTVTNLCVCVSSECVVWTLWMCACVPLWAKMSQKKCNLSCIVWLQKAEINVFLFIVHASLKSLNINEKTLISSIWGLSYFLLYCTIFAIFYLTVGHICVCIWSIVSLTLQFLPNDKQIFSKMTHRRASNVH